MGKTLEKYFKLYKVRDDLRLNCVIEYEKLESEIEKFSLNLKGLKENYIKKLVLPWIVSDKGFNYSSKIIERELESNDSKKYIKIANVLEDIGLIDKPKITEINPLSDKKELIFVKENGFFEEFSITYSSDSVPLNLEIISNRLKKYIKLEVINGLKESKLKIVFKIPRYEDINNLEDIIIFTGIDLRHISFIVKSESNYLLEGKSLDGNYIKESIVEKIKNLNNASSILEVIKVMENEIKRELPVDIYIEAFNRALDLKEFDIGFSMFLEEYFLKNPIVLKSNIDYLKEMYKRKIITSKSKELISYLNLVLEEDLEGRKALINLKEYSREFDYNFIKEVKDIYKNSSNKEGLNNVINKIINSKDIKLDNDMVDIIYSFYKKTLDIKALEKLIQNEAIVKKLDFKSKDRILILDFYRKTGVGNLKDILRFCCTSIDESDYIKKTMIKVTEEIIEENDTKKKEQLFRDNYKIIFKLSKFSKKLYEEFIVYKLYTEKDGLDIFIYEEALLKIKGRDLKKRLLERVIDYFILESDESKYVSYLNTYLEEYPLEEDYAYDLINKFSFDFIFLGVFINRIRFKDRELKRRAINKVTNAFITSKRYELLPLVIKEYKNIKAYDKGKEVLIKFIKNSSFITENIYVSTIKGMIEVLDEDRKKEVYSELIKRCDLPLDIRVRYSNLIKDESNEKIIIDGFEKGNTVSKKAKLLALKNYYEDDLKFLSLVRFGENSEEIRRLVLKKAEDKFKDNKAYVKEIIVNLDEKSKESLILNRSLEDYYKYKDNLNLAYIFGNYKVVSRYRGDLSDRVKVKSLFCDETNSGIIFRKGDFKETVLKILRENFIKYETFDKELYILEESIKDNSLKGIIRKGLDIIKLQKELINSNFTLTDFREDAFIKTSKFIFPRRIEGVIKYKENLSLKVGERFKDRILLNEPNITNLIKGYIYNDILNLQNKVEIEKLGYLKSIIKREDLNSYDRLYEELDLVFKNNFKEGRYETEES
ncbi:hypothetical protein [Clostridium chrysemydis]|uniref:hypothetical protein n=1 Tax=Clostridium chrysemydis TaxID=2665504 RepID=UPI001884643F|nr:hypothetical protein [Clostridium chrysemydis]